MRTFRYTQFTRMIRTITVLALVLSLLPVLPAYAAVEGTVTLSSTMVNATSVTYDFTFIGYTLAKNRRLSRIEIEFPAGTDLPAAVQSPQGSVSISGQVLTVQFEPLLQPTEPVTLTLSGITNPAAAGNKQAIVNLIDTNPGGQQPNSTGPTVVTYTIVAPPVSYLCMTITTPDDGQAVDFGSIDPGVTTNPGKGVVLRIASSSQYMITRDIVDTAAAAALGLAVSGVPVGTNRPAATVAAPATLTDTFTLTPPWTTEPEVPLSASVTYTVVQVP